MLKSNKKIIILVLAILVTVTLSTSYSTPADAYIHYQILNIDDQQQETDSWCWAACDDLLLLWVLSFTISNSYISSWLARPRLWWYKRKYAIYFRLL